MGDIWGLIKSLPTIISFMLELKKLWDQQVEESQRREKLQKFKASISAARDTGNSAPIVDFFNSELPSP